MASVITILVYTGIANLLEVYLVNKQFFGLYHTAIVHSKLDNESSFPLLLMCAQQFCENFV